jgi:hypothetical protein
MLRFDIFFLLEQPKNLPANSARETNRVTQKGKIADKSAPAWIFEFCAPEKGETCARVPASVRRTYTRTIGVSSKSPCWALVDFGWLGLSHARPASGRDASRTSLFSVRFNLSLLTLNHREVRNL